MEGNREEIIKMAREAGYGDAMADLHGPALERFFHMAQAAEREACAKAVEKEIDRVKPLYSVVAENAAKAIRARGQA